jgi:D-alanyl-D-alanine carboxypeptidase
VPGTKWQYSNTDFHIAGAIVEKVSGESLFTFLQQDIFRPLHMTSVLDGDAAPAPAMDVEGYRRYGNGPVRVAPRVGAGWRLGAGGLVMTPSDLARWYISLMNRSLLTARSYDALYTSQKLADGSDTNYSLGLEAWRNHGRLGLGHDGGSSGSRADSRAWPAEKIAIIAVSNEDWSMAEGVVDRLANVVLPPTPTEATARALFEGFQKGTVNRSLLSANANAYLTPTVLADQKAGLAPLGPVRTFALQYETERGGMAERTWKIVTTKARLDASERTWPDGKVEQFIVTKAE